MMKKHNGRIVKITGILLGILLFMLQTSGVFSQEKPLTCEERAIVLERTHNTRDLGGIAVKHGIVRRGLVYRSGALCFIRENDARRIDALGLKTIIDLRVPSEIKKEGGDKISLMSVKPSVVNLPMKSYRGFERLSYESYMEDNPQAIRGFFNTVADSSKLPVLFHCSAGKDRTGIMAALLLDILGASREAIFDDYLQSQRNSPHLKVNRTWLEAAFKIADEQGGTEKFLISKGVNPETLKKLRNNLVK